jgi:prepilin-type N-terminal cleavage/methylation domain-containing protein
MRRNSCRVRAAGEDRRGCRPAASSRGVTLVEILVVLVVFSVMIIAIFSSFQAAVDTQSTTARLVELRSSAIRALREIVTDLKESGRVDLSPPTGRIYPYLFTNGAATGYFAAASHASPKNKAKPGSAASGDSSEIIYVVPRDLDGDGTRINATTGAIEWGPEDWSIALLPQANGTNNLCRRKNGAIERVLARNVNRVVIQDYQSDSTLGYNQIRIRIYMTFNDGNPAHYLETSVSGTVNMRNYQEP